MREFGELKGYQGDIKGKALVDYINWIMPLQEIVIDISSNFWSHDAGEISKHFSDDVKKAHDEAGTTYEPFWNDYLKLKNTLIKDLELTDREKKLWTYIWEFKGLSDEGYSWEEYVNDFKQYHPILEEQTEEDTKFINFWIRGYENE